MKWDGALASDITNQRESGNEDERDGWARISTQKSREADDPGPAADFFRPYDPGGLTIETWLLRRQLGMRLSTKRLRVGFQQRLTPSTLPPSTDYMYPASLLI